MEKITHYVIKDKIAHILREEILNGNLKPGERLNEKELCEKLGVSRTPLREAIRNLEAEGLLETIPNKGSRVVSFTIDDVEDIYELRIMLESKATEKSVERLTDEHIRELEEIQSELREAVKNEDWYYVDTLNQSFHRMLFSQGSNERLIKIVSNLNQFGRLIRVTAFAIPGRSLKVLEEHEAILEAVKQRNAGLARELVAQHLERAKETLLKHLRK